MSLPTPLVPPAAAPPPSQLPVIRSIRDLPIAGQRVFLRLDLNVPLTGPDADGVRTVADDSRIQEALPTVKLAIEKGARIIIGSHLGRPNGKRNDAYSMEPVAAHLANLLGQDVTLADNCIGEGIDLMAQSLKNGQVLMLENLRFHAEEEANDHGFTQELARLAQLYITDAFGTAHRKHASTYALPALLPVKGMGLLIEKELQFLDRLVTGTEKPFYVILGGSKVSDKIQTVTSLLRRLQGIAIGGAMAHAFWVAEGGKIPENAKQPSREEVEAAKSILREAKRRDVPIVVAVDTNEGYDIGPKTIERFRAFLAPAKTIFWNGPLGWFEKPPYNHGTFALAEAVASMQALKVVGGGDTVSAIKQSGFAAGFDHLSTGGGAVLEYLEFGTLPGIEILRSYPRQNPVSASLT